MKEKIQKLNSINKIMTKHILSSFVFFITIMSVHAQDVEFDWAYKIGAPVSAQDNAGFIYTDEANNVYSSGTFYGTVDFDPGAGVTNLSSAFFDVYITKTDASGNLLWAKNFGGANSAAGNSIYVDALENVYITGYFYGSSDFDPGASTFTLNSNGNTDIFIIKLDALGNFVWAKNFGGPNHDYGHSIYGDDNGNIYTTGSFSGTVDFDPGAGTTSFTTLTSQEMFISKLNASGDLVWAKHFTGNNSLEGKSICIDSNGDVISTGNFRGTIDFDPGTATYNLTSNGNRDVFVSKLNANGDFVWAKNMGGSNQDQGVSVGVDDNNNVYTSGWFNNVADFDPGTATFDLSSNGTEDIFVSKLNQNGDLVWAKSIGAANTDKPTGMYINSIGDVYLTGIFNETVDFDPNMGVSNLVSEANQDIFISKFNTNGNFTWAKRIGGPNGDRSTAISTDDFGSIYITGDFYDTLDVDPGNGVNELISSGSQDIFVLKLKCAPSSGTLTVEACGSYVFNGITYTSSNNSALDTLVNQAGCDSIIHLDLIITNIDVFTTLNGNTISANATGLGYQWIDCSDNSVIPDEVNASFTASQNGDYAVIITDGLCSDTSECTEITSVGIVNMNSADNALKIYPNPSAHTIYISNFDTSIKNVNIIDLTGKTVLSLKAETNEISINSLKNGIYFVKIFQENQITTQKIIVKK